MPSASKFTINVSLAKPLDGSATSARSAVVSTTDTLTASHTPATPLNTNNPGTKLLVLFQYVSFAGAAVGAMLVGSSSVRSMSALITYARLAAPK